MTDHTKARAIAEALTHGGADDIELIELAAAYLSMGEDIKFVIGLADRLKAENERLRGALHPGRLPDSTHHVFREASGKWGTNLPEDTANVCWCFIANRYEQLTGLRVDGEKP